ncbi:MAG: SGNH/GDSL hydrolase family protein [Gammaproteobacteria bacterium]
MMRDLVCMPSRKTKARRRPAAEGALKKRGTKMTTIKQGSAARAASVLWLAIAIGCGEAALGEPGEGALGSIDAASFTSRTVSSMAVIGDSITRAYNAGGGEFFQGGCAFADQTSYSWATNDNNGTLCTADTVYSHKERLECANNKNLSAYNVAVSGANMRDDAYKQTVAARNWIVTRAAPRYIAFLLGHNDICQGHRDKYSSCTQSSTKDPNNYCRTTNFAFEKQFRRALDVLVRIPDSRIGVAIPVRVSQLCNHRGKNVDFGFIDFSCQDVWDTAQAEIADVFEGPGICESVTSDDCSDARVAHAHRTWRAYKNILIRVTNEYAAVTAGAKIPANATFGTGNVTKASGVQVQYSEAISNFKLKSSDIQNCDCFHPSYSAQNKISQYLYRGLTCTATTPCCRDVGTSNVDDGKCRYTWTDGRKIPALW